MRKSAELWLSYSAFGYCAKVGNGYVVCLRGVSWRFGVADSRVLTGIGNGRALAAGF